MLESDILSVEVWQGLGGKQNRGEQNSLWIKTVQSQKQQQQRYVILIYGNPTWLANGLATNSWNKICSQKHEKKIDNGKSLVYIWLYICPMRRKYSVTIHYIALQCPNIWANLLQLLNHVWFWWTVPDELNWMFKWQGSSRWVSSFLSRCSSIRSLLHMGRLTATN